MTGNLWNKPGVQTNPPRSTGGFTILELLVIILVIGALAALLLPAVRTAGPAARRVQCKSNLREVAIALHRYIDEYHAFPPAYTVDADGKRLHSWRTLILPYIEQQSLYQKIDLSKAWDDPANAEAFREVIPAYVCPDSTSPPDHTTYLAVVAENSCLRATEPRSLSEIVDPGKTLLLIEVDADHAVHWMAPTDADESLVLTPSPETKLPHESGMHAAFVDGTVHFLSAETSADVRRALISVNAADKQPLKSNSDY